MTPQIEQARKVLGDMSKACCERIKEYTCPEKNFKPMQGRIKLMDENDALFLALRVLGRLTPEFITKILSDHKNWCPSKDEQWRRTAQAILQSLIAEEK